jgi:hypothetical protein
VIGDDHFIDRALGATPDTRLRGVDLDRIVQYVCEGMGLAEYDLRAPGEERGAAQARALAGWLVVPARCATLSEAARRFKRDLRDQSGSVDAGVICAGGRDCGNGSARTSNINIARLTVTRDSVNEN